MTYCSLPSPSKNPTRHRLQTSSIGSHIYYIPSITDNTIHCFTHWQHNICYNHHHILGENDDNLPAVSPVSNSICPHRCEMQICGPMSSNSHHTGHIIVANSHDRNDPVLRLAPCSGRVATAIEGRVTTTAHQLGPMLQLNGEGISAAKIRVVEQLAHNNKVIAILLQETLYQSWFPCNRRLWTLCTHTTSKHHGLATFVSHDATWSTVPRSHFNSEIEWLAIRIDDTTIVNIYKPPPTRLIPTSLPSFGNQCIYAGRRV